MLKRESISMTMPVKIQIVGFDDRKEFVDDILDQIFDYFEYIDHTFSTYKADSEISKLNRKEINLDEVSEVIKEIFKLSDEYKIKTNGYFDIYKSDMIDPLGIVKGFAIKKGSEMLKEKGINNFCFEIAGDMQTSGFKENGEKWNIGIENPFESGKIVKVVHLNNKAVASSGNYIRGKHIYNPRENFNASDEVASVTIIADDIVEADVYATAVFAMGEAGKDFIKNTKGIGGYIISKAGIATYNQEFEKYII